MKKIFAAVVLVFVSSIAVLAQKSTPPAALSVVTEPLPVTFFKNLQAGKTQTVVVYGTSLSHTAEWPKGLKEYFEKQFPGRITFINSASSGKQSDWGVANLDRRLLSKNPDLVLIEFSMNDAATKHNISVEKALANLDRMVRALRKQNPQMDIVLQTMNPAWDSSAEAQNKKYASERPHLADYYEAYRRYARENNLPLVDHYPAWLTLQQEDEKKFGKWIPDGCHPIPEASRAVTLAGIVSFLEKARSAAGTAVSSISPRDTDKPAPTFSNIAYGGHPRQVLDFYKTPSNTGKPAPLVFYMHGGGWVNGDKKDARNIAKYLDAGVSVVSINYRYTTQAQEAGVMPPVEWPMRDAARALQFVRSKAADWNIDKQRIGATGTSAGACTALWLTFHDDMADPRSNDPISRESTRLWCVAVDSAQTSLDPQQMKEWTPNSRYGGHAFGFMNPKDKKTRDTQFDKFLAQREDMLPLIKKYSPIEHVSADDPPVYLFYKTVPALGQPAKDPTHSANFGVKLQEKLKATGVPCELVYPGAPGMVHADIVAFLIDTLAEKNFRQ